MVEPVRSEPQISLLILAAGASSRMRGADKLLERVDGQPLLRRVAQLALGTRRPVVVTLAENRPSHDAALEHLDLTRVRVADAAEGMSASLRAGVAAIDPSDAILVMLADMPDLDAADLAAMTDSYSHAPSKVHRATSPDGTPGHPVIFPPSARQDLLALSGDVGARLIMASFAGRLQWVTLPGTHATTDLDTPDDWARWRTERPVDNTP